MDTLTEKELTIIDRIGSNGGQITQRDIAEHAGLSLGLTNIILKRLIKKGYIKMSQLTPKKMQYILTKKGMIEKAKKSYKYIFKTFREMKNINNSIQNLLEKEYQSGVRKIGIIGNNDLIEIMEILIPKTHGVEVIKLENGNYGVNTQKPDVIFDCRDEVATENNVSDIRTINVTDYIANVSR